MWSVLERKQQDDTETEGSWKISGLIRSQLCDGADLVAEETAGTKVRRWARRGCPEQACRVELRESGEVARGQDHAGLSPAGRSSIYLNCGTIHTREFPISPSARPTPSLWETLTCFLSRMDFSVLNISYKWNHTLHDWLPSLSMMFLRVVVV